MVDRLQEMVARLGEQVQTLVRLEIALAKSEVSDKVRGFGKAAVYGAIAGVFAFFAVFGLLLTMIWVLDVFLPLWASALIVTAFFLLLAAIFGLIAMRKAKQASPPLPEATIATVRPLPSELREAAT